MSPSVAGPPTDTEIASGDGWTLVARVDGEEIIRRLTTTDGASEFRGTLAMGEGSGIHVDFSGHVAKSAIFWMHGMTSLDVSRVQIVLQSGGIVDTAVVGTDAGFSVGFYAVTLPRGQRPVEVVALDGEGNELERVDASLATAV